MNPQNNDKLNEHSIIKRRSAAAQASSIDRIVQSAKAPLIDKLKEALEINRELVEVLEACFPHIEALMLNGGCSNDIWKQAREVLSKAKGDSR